ncbi:hypothetical protein ACN469_00450 [Corallococcus terminator]
MASIVSGMQIQISNLMRRGALLAVLALTACGTGAAPGGEDLALESSEAALACQVTQQCSNSTSVSCSSASGVCASGTESGGWVECDGVRKYCPTVACTCGSTRLVETGRGTSFNCSAAYGLAQEDAYARMEGRCPAGACNVTEAQAGCSAGSGGQTARYTVTFSCNEPANCQ